MQLAQREHTGWEQEVEGQSRCPDVVGPQAAAAQTGQVTREGLWFYGRSASTEGDEGSRWLMWRVWGSGRCKVGWGAGEEMTPHARHPRAKGAHSPPARALSPSDFPPRVSGASALGLAASRAQQRGDWTRET